MNEADFIRKRDELERCLDRTNFWISNCDQKASVVLGFLGVFIGLIFSSDNILSSIKTVFQNLWDSITDHSCPDIFALTIVSFLLLSFCELCLCIRYLFDTIRAKIDPSVFKQDGLCTTSKVHYQSIITTGYKWYKQSREERDFAEELNDYYSQIYINSQICTDKFTNYNKAISTAVHFLVLFIATLLLLLFYSLKL